jgi:hypothetical protein
MDMAPLARFYGLHIATPLVGVFDPPTPDDIEQLRVWLWTAELRDPPMITMPGVEAWSPELTRMQLLAETASPMYRTCRCCIIVIGPTSTHVALRGMSFVHSRNPRFCARRPSCWLCCPDLRP